MGSNTSKLGLYLPGGGSTGLITPDEPADIDKINDNMVKIDADAGAFVCTSSTRPSSPYNGKIIYETDTNNTRVWRSATSTWDLVNRVTETVPINKGGTGATTVAEARDNLGVGLVPIIPTSVTNVGGTSSYSSVTGKITFNAITDLKIQGIFSSAFDSYKLYFVLRPSASMEPRVRLLVGSTAQTASQYAWSGISTSGGATQVFGGSGIDYFPIAAGVSGFTHSADFDIVNARDATATTGMRYWYSGFTTNWQNVLNSGGYNVLSAVDGFNLYSTSAATLTGHVMVYGYKR